MPTGSIESNWEDLSGFAVAEDDLDESSTLKDHLPDYTKPEPKRRPRPPEEEGEAARNNVVMSKLCPRVSVAVPTLSVIIIR